MRSGEPRFPGIVGYDDTVLPEVERALLAGHDMVLLGERGQGKTRLIRVAGRAARRVDPGDRRARSSTSTRCTRSPRPPRRRVERARRRPAGRLAAPLAAVRREAGHPGHQRRRPDRRRRPDPGRPGPHPRRPGDHPLRPGAAHQPRHLRRQRAARPGRADPGQRCSTCSRSATSRSAATSCGCRWTCCWWPAPTRRTTPTAAGSSPRSRTGSAPRSAPTTRSTSTWRSPWSGRRPQLVAEVPEHVLEVLARFARAVRESPAVDARSGVSARFADRRRRDRRRRRRCAAPGCSARPTPVARIGDAVSVTSTLRGKVEFESGEEGREVEVLAHLLRTATAETFRARLAGLDLSGFVDLVAERRDHRDRRAGRRRRGAAPGRHRCRAWPRCWTGSAWATRRAAARRPPGVEFVLEGLHLTRRLSKALTDGRPHRCTGAGVTMRRNRYGAWHGGPDPLAPPYDVRGRGRRGRRRGAGRRQPARRAAQPAAARARTAAAAWTTCSPGPAGCAARRCAAGELDGAVTRAQQLLDQALAAERDELAGRDDDDARFAEAHAGQPAPLDRPGGRGAGRLRLGQRRGRARSTSRSSTSCGRRWWSSGSAGMTRGAVRPGRPAGRSPR